jgi:phosphoglycolate phosphatase-like HAD superfamily hydrolase
LNVEATIFDLDGTLVCLPIDYDALFDTFRKIMNTNDVRPIVDKVSKLDSQTRLNVFAAWDEAELAVAKDSTVCKEGSILYHKYLKKPKALVTLQGRKAVAQILRCFHFSFDVVVTREDSLFRADQLKLAISKLKVAEANILFVGNTDGDSEAAKTVGCNFQMVTV